MPTLLLRLAAPLQAWGDDCKFEIRRTQREPTKSGVIGMLAAAMGLRRDDDEEIVRLNMLKFGVRADREGRHMVDYHTVRGEKPYLTYRYYLADAVFLVGLEGEEDGFLRELEHALRNPAFPLYLGRRSCPPTLPIVLGIRACGLEQTLMDESILTENAAVVPLRIQVETKEPGESATYHDVALSFCPQKRQYGYRKVKEFYINRTPEVDTEHDVMSELE